MASVVKPLAKFALTVGASAIGAGPLCTLTHEIALPILSAILGKDGTEWVSKLSGDVVNNLAGDYAKEFFDSLKSEPPQELHRIWVLALRQALTDAREKFRKEHGERLPITGEWMLPDDQEKFFTDCLAKLEHMLGDKIDLEIMFRDQPALDAIYDEDQSAGWAFLESNLTEWAGKSGFPEDLREHLRLELPGILSDRFSSILASPHYQQAFNKHQAHFTEMLYRSLSGLHLKVDTANEGIEELNRKADLSDQKQDMMLDVLHLVVQRLDAIVVAQPAADHRIQTDLTEFRQGRIREWSQERYRLDKRFVGLTLMIDKGENEPQRWQKEENRFTDLRDVLQAVDERHKTRVIALLGNPGSGKSTLLRRLQLDHSIDRMYDGRDEVSLFVQLNDYRAPENGVLPQPGEWLESIWKERYPELKALKEFLREGRVLLLLDALNEMPQKSDEEYFNLVGYWRSFAQKVAPAGNRIVFSCRSLDYSAPLSSNKLNVPQVDLMPMNREQIRAFLRAYIPEHEATVWSELEKSDEQMELFQTPYFLKILCDQVEEFKSVPKGRAELFTGFIRHALDRERGRNGDLFKPGSLLDRRDHVKLSQKLWETPFELPEIGELIPRLSRLAFSMQNNEKGTQRTHIRIPVREARRLIDHDKAEEIIKAGDALNVLDEDVKKGEVLFYHQLLQEYFAARKLASEPEPARVHVEWMVDKVSPTLEETLAGLADGDPLPPLPQTGWEETTLIAAPMADDPDSFIWDLIPHNLPLAARCAASPEVNVSLELRREIQDALIARTQDMKVDLRARISAGEALGEIGDPRFELREGPYGEYLLPPMVEIAAGIYPIGDDQSDYDFEKPAHTVEVPAFQIGMFPVTNAEYAKFMAAGGYENEKWWDTEEALGWLKGEGSTEGQKANVRDLRKTLQGLSEDQIRALVAQNRATSEQVEGFLSMRGWTDDYTEQVLEEWFPSGRVYRQPEFWDDIRFNNSAQPVVGVTWFEARAYCNWLTANSGAGGEQIFRLPTEVEFEAAARGVKGRKFPYGDEFEMTRSNTFESHIRRSTPVGIFDNATPEGAYDLSGNVYTWTTSIYDQENFPYPYRHEPEREEITATEVRRVLRGGSWLYGRDLARAVYRVDFNPFNRVNGGGFRLVLCGRPPSQ